MIDPDRELLSYSRNLAAALVHGEWTPAQLHKHATLAVGPRKRWLKPLLNRVQLAFPQLPRLNALAVFLAADVELNAVRAKYFKKHHLPLAPARYYSTPARMQAPSAPVVRFVPELQTLAQLAGWLGIPVARLNWYADRKGLNRSAAENLRHYRYRWLPKRTPGAYRLLEEPKPVLKSIQRQILIDILGCINPHDAAHGFRRQRSIVTNAAVHCGRAIVVRFDLKDFFPSIPAGKVAGLFDALGYPEPVPKILAGLCTTRLPYSIWQAKPGANDDTSHSQWLRLGRLHLPQGAPTSPALANLCTFGLDVRLSALARNIDATYTRYADDLTFSGPAELAVDRLRRSVLKICAEEGFALNLAKTRIQRRSNRQRVAGVVVNVRPNIPRDEFDALKATLTNCLRTGPEEQNRDGHGDFRAYLSGRIAFVAMVNTTRGRKLWAIFDCIVWPQAGAMDGMELESAGELG